MPDRDELWFYWSARVWLCFIDALPSQNTTTSWVFKAWALSEHHVCSNARSAWQSHLRNGIYLSICNLFLTYDFTNSAFAVICVGLNVLRGLPLSCPVRMVYYCIENSGSGCQPLTYRSCQDESSETEEKK